MKIKYIGSIFDSSGYADAARNNIAALHLVGADLEVQAVSFESFKSNLGKLGSLCKKLSEKKHTDPDIQIIHLTPQHFPRMRHPTAYNIGYSTWETSKLPPNWAEMLNSMDELWVPSQHNVEVFKRSGVTKPIYCFPHTFNTTKEVDSEASSIIQSLADDEFVFYNIFQWLERKNPISLLIAYLTEFTRDDNVALILKTYLMTPGKENEIDIIKAAVSEVKTKLWLDSYPKVLLITSLLSTDQIASLHARGDCMVSLTRCEGYGIPLAEAMLAGNPVITTNYGGPIDFIDHKRTGFLVESKMTPTFGMPWDIYKGDMKWGDPDIIKTSKYMRLLYENRDRSKAMGIAAKKQLRKDLGWNTIGKAMLERLERVLDDNQSKTQEVF